MTNEAIKLDTEVVYASVNRIGALTDEIKNETQAYLTFMEECVQRVQNGDKSFEVIVNQINKQAANIQDLIAAQNEVNSVLTRYIQEIEAAEDVNDQMARELEE